MNARHVNARSLLGGLVLGFALGWVVFGLPSRDAGDPAPETIARPAATASDDATLVGQTAGPETAHPEPPEAGAEPALAEVFARGTWAELCKRADEAESPFPDEAVVAFEARLRQSREDGDLRLFLGVITALGRAGTSRADDVLIEIVGDEGISFPHPQNLAYAVRPALERSEQAGIAAAARRRFEKNVRDGMDSWVAAEGWMDFVAQHGDLEDVHWLLARKESGQIRDRALGALGRVQDPAAMAFVRGRLLEGNAWGKDRDILTAFVEHHDAEGWEVIRELLDRALRTGDTPPQMSLGHLLLLAATAGWPDRAGEVEELFRSLSTREHRVAALSAVNHLDRQGADVSALGSIFAAPIEVVAALGPDDLVSGSLRKTNVAAWRSFLTTPALLTQENVELLEAAAERMGLHPAADLREVPRKMRAKLASGWRTE